MGFIPNFFPPRVWFAGRVYLTATLKQINEYKSNNEVEQNLYSKYDVAVLNVIRGIRTIYFLPADKIYEKHDFNDLLIELKLYIKSELFEKLVDLVNYNPKVGYNQGELKDRDSLKKANIKELFEKGINERIQLLEELIGVAIDIFYEVYYKEKKDDIDYSDFYVGHDTVLVYNKLVKYGFIDEIETSLSEFSDEFNVQNDYPDIVEECLTDIYEDNRGYHNDDFWEWKEENAY